MLAATNPRASVHWLECVGAAAWLGFWLLENAADTQKMAFVKAAKKNVDLRVAVLGHTPPYNTPKYWLWTKSRHPNLLF